LSKIASWGKVMKISVVSDRKTKSYAALAGVPLTQINDEAGLGNTYIYRLWGCENVEIATLNRVVAVLRRHGVEVSVCDLLEEVEVAEVAPAAL
jgi:N-acyl-L-homoserine lactone synthetase